MVMLNFFLEWFTDEKLEALFTAATIVRDFSCFIVNFERIAHTIQVSLLLRSYWCKTIISP